MLILHENFLKEVEKNWNMPASHVGLKKIKEKLFRLKQFLVFWNKKMFGNVFERVKKLELEVANAELQVQNTPIDTNSLNLKHKQALCDAALEQEEALWRQKSSANWCALGERNTALFHMMAKRKRARMCITNN